MNGRLRDLLPRVEGLTIEGANEGREVGTPPGSRQNPPMPTRRLLPKNTYERELLAAAKTPEQRARIERFLRECPQVDESDSAPELEVTFFQPRKPPTR